VKSVTDQILGDGTLDSIIEEGKAAPNEDLVREPPVDIEAKREGTAMAKLRVAYAMRNPHGPARAAGVGFASPGRGQMQEIFDDRSVRNPYKVNRNMSGRQRKKMRKAANRALRAQGNPGRIEDVLKGRRAMTPVRPQQETDKSPVPAAAPSEPTGTSVAAQVGD
jgi:hypothetical protein